MKFNFQILWMAYYILLSMVGGLIITISNELPFIDGLFIATSATTASGLSSISMKRCNLGSFVVLALLMVFGNSGFVLTNVMLTRRRYLSKILSSNDNIYHLKSAENIAFNSSGNSYAIPEALEVYNSLSLFSKVVIIYIIMVPTIGGSLFIAALYIQANIPELDIRHFNRVDNAVFLSISSFTNTGITITSDSLIGINNNPFAYIILSIMILLGDSLMPVLLRLIVKIIAFGGEQRSIFRKHHRYMLSPQEVKAAKYILSNPHKIVSSLIFDERKTQLIFRVTIGLALFQYFVFLLFTLTYPAATSKYSRVTLSGLGYFQAISTRSAGFTVLDLRELNQGVIFIYGTLCYFTISKCVAILEGHHIDEQLINHPVPAPKFTSVNTTAYNPIATSITNVDTDPHSLHLSEQSTFSSPVRSSNYEITEISSVRFIDRLINLVYFRTLWTHTNMLFLACIVLSFAEDKILSDPHIDVNMWYVIFEVLSSYGGVGLSLGVPGETYSLSGAFTSFGKFVIICVAILGKHRGLPKDGDSCIDFEFRELLINTRRESNVVSSTST